MNAKPNVFLNPSPTVLAKVGSALVHIDEFMGASGHEFDRVALQSLLDDPDVRAFLAAGRKLAMLPEQRR